MPATRRRPGDHTGRIKEQLAKEREAELREAATRMSVVTELPEGAISEVDEIEVANTDDLDAKPPTLVDDAEPSLMTMRVSDKVEQMTFGNDSKKQWNFEPGFTYRVPTPIYRHLDEKGYVYH
jgi:hypothetical protein